MAMVTNGAVVATHDGMPPESQEAVMSPAELIALIEAAGHADTPHGELAKLVGFSRPQWWRLRTGETNIGQRSADLIKSKLKPLKKRKK